MNNINCRKIFLVLLILVFVLSLSEKVFAANLPSINYNGSNLYISPTNNSGSISWGPDYTPVAGALSDTDGFGNTTAIVDTFGGGSYAAKVCSDLNIGAGFNGYTDWYLPAIDQLSAIYSNSVNEGDGFTPLASEWYWSSTELSNEYSVNFSIGLTPPATYARIKHFGNGGSDIYTKNSFIPVRCVRSNISHEVTVGTMARVSGDTTSTVNIDATPVMEGEIVTLTVVPKEGMRLKVGTLLATYNEAQTATLANINTNSYTFIMPSYEVMVTATFEVIPRRHISSGSYPVGNEPNVIAPNFTVTSIFTFLNNLKLGMEHSDVKELQKFLNTHNFPISLTEAGSSSNETNYFGKLTKQAVIKFQISNGLVGDGIVGPLTREVLNK